MTNPADTFHVSLIVTVLNEASAIGGLLDSISAQTRPPDEVVIADGGSHDGTPELIRVWGAGKLFPVQVLSVAGANISRGRNAAIQAARGEWIACTDAGVRLDPAWLARLLEPLHAAKQSAQTLEVVSGFFVPDPRSTFELAMGATVLPAVGDVDPVRFLPSSRSIAFAKSAWQTASGYPEWLDYCEDLVFDLALRRRGAFAFAPGALVYFRPRASLRSFFRQYYRYARGDGKADLWRRRQALRYGLYLLAVPLLLALAALVSPLFWLLLAAGGLAYTRAPFRRLLPALGRLNLPQKLYALGLVPVIRVTGDLAKMIGYPVGVVWRLRHPQLHPSTGNLPGP
jgi:glycosyltransferase involved in cell wall biosynthesis